MKNKRSYTVVVGMLSAVLAVGAFAPTTVLAEGTMGWREENGEKYWYENDVKQGLEGRGKEIYDPESDAWYWLDSVDGGRMAKSKDVYQESWAGQYADREDGTGKWVRYDANGHMVKGWDSNDAGTYYFDLQTGAMAKGFTEIDGKPCAFDWGTGIGVDCQWVDIDGNQYWYEGGVRQGLEGRGKEIYDPASDAWYWLDSVDGGKKAVSKDVYQESSGGKWVRYDANGHMIKGWNEQNGSRYYFDPVTGAMAKGVVNVDGMRYIFNKDTGICEGEYTSTANTYWGMEKTTMHKLDGTEMNHTEYKYDANGREVESAFYAEGVLYSKDSCTYNADGTEAASSHWSTDSTGREEGYTYKYEYDNAKHRIKETQYDLNGAKNYEDRYTYKGDHAVRKDTYTYDSGKERLFKYELYEYDGKGNLIKKLPYHSNVWDVNDNEFRLSYYETYEYDGNGNLVKKSLYSEYRAEFFLDHYETYEYDAAGNKTKETGYDGDGTVDYRTETTYEKIGDSYYIKTDARYDGAGIYLDGVEHEYFANGSLGKITYYDRNKVRNSYIVYEASTPETGAVGDTCEIKSTRYNNAGKALSYTIDTYRAYELAE